MQTELNNNLYQKLIKRKDKKYNNLQKEKEGKFNRGNKNNNS